MKMRAGWARAAVLAFVYAGGGALAQNPPLFQAPRDLVQPAAAPRLPDTIVAKVNETAIRQKDVDREVERAFVQMASQIPPEQHEQARQQLGQRALDGLIVRHLLLQDAERKGIRIEEEEMARVRAQIKAQLPPEQTMDALYAAMGVTAAEFEENLQRDLRVQKLIAQLAENVPVPTEAETREFYTQHEAQMTMPERVRARHILVRSPESDPQALRADRKAKAEEIRKKLVEGADFVEMVKEHSEDPGSVGRGGEYVFGRGQMTPPFEQAAFSQEINAIGPVIETTFGYHILQVLERQAARRQTFEEVAPRIVQFMQNRERQRRVEQYIKDLRAAAKIEFPQP